MKLRIHGDYGQGTKLLRQPHMGRQPNPVENGGLLARPSLVRPTLSGRLHSLATDYFRSAHLQGPLFGNELEKWSVRPRPRAEVDIARVNAQHRPLEPSICHAELRGLARLSGQIIAMVPQLLANFGLAQSIAILRGDRLVVRPDVSCQEGEHHGSR